MFIVPRRARSFWHYEVEHYNFTSAQVASAPLRQCGKLNITHLNRRRFLSSEEHLPQLIALRRFCPEMQSRTGLVQASCSQLRDRSL